MLVMAVLAAVAAPRLTDRSVLQERAVQDQLRSLLRTSRQTALAQGRDVCVLLTPSAVRAVYTAGGACTPALPLAGSGGEAQLRVDAPAGLAFSGTPLLRFDTRGRPVPAADSVLTVGVSTLTVYRETGFVR